MTSLHVIVNLSLWLGYETTIFASNFLFSLWFLFANRCHLVLCIQYVSPCVGIEGCHDVSLWIANFVKFVYLIRLWVGYVDNDRLSLFLASFTLGDWQNSSLLYKRFFFTKSSLILQRGKRLCGQFFVLIKLTASEKSYHRTAWISDLKKSLKIQTIVSPFPPSVGRKMIPLSSICAHQIAFTPSPSSNLIGAVT